MIKIWKLHVSRRNKILIGGIFALAGVYQTLYPQSHNIPLMFCRSIVASVLRFVTYYDAAVTGYDAHTDVDREISVPDSTFNANSCRVFDSIDVLEHD